MMKKICLLLVLTCSVGLGVASSLVTGYEPAGLDELDKQKGTFKTTLIRPDADFSRYTRIQTKTVALVLRDTGGANEFSTGRLLAKREKESVVPEYDEVVEFKRIVGETLASELESTTGLELVDETGPNTLVLQPVVTDVVLSSSSKNKSEDGRELPELEQGTIVFDLIDGETGLIVARMAERRRCKPPKDVKKTTGLFPNLAYWTECAAVDLCHELERVGS